MIVHRLIAKKGIVVLTPESADDLWTIRRVVSIGDNVSGETSRAVKDSGEFKRPDKGERIKISITIKVERIILDSALERLRISGEIISSNNELVSTGGSHSLIITPMKRLGVKKPELSKLDIHLLKKSQGEDTGFILIVLDRRDAGLGVVKGVHLQILPSISSGFSGKFYRETQKPIGPFFKKIEYVINSVFQKNMKIYVSGPGNTKNEFLNFLTDSGSLLINHVELVDGIDSTGEDGVYLALHSKNLRNLIDSTKLGRAAAILEEAIKRISLDDGRITIGFREAYSAAISGAIDSILVSDKIFEIGVDESDLINLLNKVESQSGKVYLIDTSTDLGVQVSKLGGIISLLRYPIYSS